jgi:hypothetical protein
MQVDAAVAIAVLGSVAGGVVRARQMPGDREPQLTNADRWRLTILGRKLGRKALGSIAAIAVPETIFRWLSAGLSAARTRHQVEPPPVLPECTPRLATPS